MCWIEGLLWLDGGECMCGPAVLVEWNDCCGWMGLNVDVGWNDCYGWVEVNVTVD